MKNQHQLPAHLVDLQMHSRESDGDFELAEVVARCIKRGIKIVAFTEHDTLAHIPVIQRVQQEVGDKIRILPAIELSLSGKNALPVDTLAFGFDPTNRDLIGFVESLNRIRQNRIYATVKILRNLGFEITEDAVMQICPNGNGGKKEIAKAVVRDPANEHLLKKIGVQNGDYEGFRKAMLLHYDLGRVPLGRVPVEEGCDAVHKADGICILAHPRRTFGAPGMVFLDKLILDYQAMGIDGIECFYRHHSREETSLLLNATNKAGLLCSAGSDFHRITHSEDVGVWPDYGLCKKNYLAPIQPLLDLLHVPFPPLE